MIKGININIFDTIRKEIETLTRKRIQRELVLDTSY